jgi:diaminohydroxyphosphoribosylaminopyrimidine deaminase/5-amino-6-(5-phosphoribosylamino)uracil reductase
MVEETDVKFMNRCLELASKAEGMTYPNPMVGSVIVHDGLIIGEGYHRKAGSPHAEVNAINSVRNRDLLKTSTLYVNLEPCSHFGRTPPCSDLIISEQIRRVVIGTSDTSEKVSGRGAASIRAAGFEVVTGVAAEDCRWLNRRFFMFHEKKRPYIILKWAQSSDGFMDIERPEGAGIGPNWITGKPERVLVHRWRAAEQAILAGAGTIRRDNPYLNVREWKGDNPVRIILSGSGNLPEDLAVYKSIGSVVIFTHNPGNSSQGNAVVVKLNHTEPASVQIADYLFQWGIQSLLIEGGATLLEHFISTGLWDEARIFTGSEDFIKGIEAPRITGSLISRTQFSSSILEVIVPQGH